MTVSPARLLRALPLLVLLVAGCAYFNTFYNAQGYFREGMRLKDQQQVSQAKAKFEKSIEKSALVISRWPGSRWVDDATFLIGRAYYEMGQYGKAVHHFERLVLAFPNSGFAPQARLYRGLSLLRDKEYGEARVVLEDVKRRYPKLRDEASYELALSFYRRDDFPRAADSLAAFVERFPKSRRVPAAVENLAECCYRLERWQQAEEWYSRLVRVQRDPKKRAEAQLRVAASELEQGRAEEAVGQARDVLGRYPDLDDEANVLLGRAYQELDRSEEAVSAWSKVRGNSDLGAEAFFRIGKFHEEHKEFGLASAFYDTARSRRANSDYGVLAVKRLALLDALAPDDSTEREPAEALFLLAEVHNLNLAEYDEAERLYRQVYDSFPASDFAPKALFAEAWIDKNIKKDSVATRALLDRIIAEYPETEYADESKRWLGMKVPKRRKPEPEKPPVPDTPAATPRMPESPVPDTVAGLTRLPGEEPPEFEPGMHGSRPHEPHKPGPPSARPMPGEPEPPVAPAEVPGKRPEPVPPESPLGVFGQPETTTTEPMVEQAGEPEAPVDTGAATRVGLADLGTVHFGFDQWDIRAGDEEKLEAAARALKENPGTTVTVTGYCDPVGTEEYNLVLGRRRAKAVRDWLVKAGVDPGQLDVESRGEADTVSDLPAGYWRDRRVEFNVK